MQSAGLGLYPGPEVDQHWMPTRIRVVGQPGVDLVVSLTASQARSDPLGSFYQSIPTLPGITAWCSGIAATHLKI
jgi:hypothetical protein